jgi:hypothetical protein
LFVGSINWLELIRRSPKDEEDKYDKAIDLPPMRKEEPACPRARALATRLKALGAREPLLSLCATSWPEASSPARSPQFG